MSLRATLRRAQLHYAGGMAVHTASSGAVQALDALYLLLDDGVHRGVGEVRLNIAYLTGLAPQAVLDAARRFVSPCDWPEASADLRAFVAALPLSVPAPVRMLVDLAVHDLLARREGVLLAHMLGGTGVVRHPTNQTLFFSDMPTFQRRCIAYVARGFTQLKIRIGADLDADLDRLRWLRDHFGADITLSADANGQWDERAALTALDRLAAFRLDYVEQPVAAGDWAVLERVAARSPVPLMLDESLADMAACRRLAEMTRPPMAHLKLVKLGGLAALLSAARMLQAAGVTLMIGQMNEGAIATAAALHAACVLTPRFAELYGADGLADDPASGLVYRDGAVGLAGMERSGFGLAFDATLTQPQLFMETC
ncbi:mandelate racemase/muconate lactonizing enzyme family protein [Gluconacetobacter dulcium]|uniref:mandelate racemase/muconate lactonizing enzyme family protein n=1 Tax=Gluconacetobacter dulcium TaxID=2729096 RepID=UPI001C7FC62B|nr:enolase C-terminal domain-like protein [Gluconacetobacter dulcium]